MDIQKIKGYDMEKSIVFCFTGTGNSLTVARDIADKLENCVILDIGHTEHSIEVSEYSRIGFVFPVYFLGLPLRVAKFIEGLSVPPGFPGFLFSIATYANVRGNAVKQAGAILQKQGQRQNYAAYVKMGDNAIAFYGSNPNIERLAVSYRQQMDIIIPKIVAKETILIGRKFQPFEAYYNMMIPRMQKRDEGFQLLDACTKCGICSDVCPVNNICVRDGKPEFGHNCEQCMACIQLCPQKAIDYKGKCAKRNRYKHPNISINDLIEFHSPPDVTIK